MIQFEKTSRPATGARLPIGSHMQGGGTPYKSFSSAALDPHPTVANPLLPFGKFGQTVLDIASLFVAFLLVTASGLGIAFALFVLLFVQL